MFETTNQLQLETNSSLVLAKELRAKSPATWRCNCVCCDSNSRAHRPGLSELGIQVDFNKKNGL